jgi:multiple sugar transport system ATP-binding protein
MIYVTHDQIEAMSMGDRIVVMKDGLVQQVDTPLNIYHHPANQFVAGFIGSPTMNFMKGTVDASGTYTFHQQGTSFSLALPGSYEARLKQYSSKPITLGIRPEHIYSARPTSAESIASFKTQIEVVEPVGNEIFVYFSTGTDAHYVARIASDVPPSVGKAFELYFDTSKIHFFTSDTQQTI